MKSIVKSAEARASLERWYDVFRGRVSAPTTERTVPTRWGDAHVLAAGPEDAPPVVLLHGALASSAHALAEIAPLCERRRVYAVDVVGQSVKSADVRPDVAGSTYGEWLADVLDGLGLARASVVGVSWGGFVAVRLAALAPERVEKLALVVPAGIVRGPAVAGFLDVGWPMLAYVAFPSRARLDRALRHLLTTRDDGWADYLGDALRAYRLDMRVPPLATPAELATFRAPTLVVAGELDLSFPGAALLARAAELFPNLAGTELVAGCRHCPPMTDEFRAWLSGRLERFLAA